MAATHSKLEEEIFKALQEGSEKSLVIAKELLAKNPNININYIFQDPSNSASMPINPSGNSLLMQALDKEHLDIAQLLLSKGANPWLKNIYGQNAIHMLCMVKHNLDKKKKEELLGLLNALSKIKGFEDQINLPAADDKRSPLALAVTYPPLDFMQELIPRLIQHGAKYISIERPLWTQMIDHNDCMSRIQFLEKLPSKPKEMLEELSLKKFLEPSEQFDGKVAIQAAISTGKLALLKYCFEKGNRSLEIINSSTLPALAGIAVRATPLNPEVIGYLFEIGADPTLKYANKDFHERLEDLKKRNTPGSKELSTSLAKMSEPLAKQNKSDQGTTLGSGPTKKG